MNSGFKNILNTTVTIAAVMLPSVRGAVLSWNAAFCRFSSCSPFVAQNVFDGTIA